MIRHIDDRTELIFGTGDIGFNPGVIDDKYPIGVMVMYNQDPRTIGAPGDVRAGTTINIEDYPVVMNFHKTESIDVLVTALLEIKGLMRMNLEPLKLKGSFR